MAINVSNIQPDSIDALSTHRIEMENGEHQIESKYVLLPPGVCSTGRYKALR